MKNEGATQNEVLSWCNNFEHFSMLAWSGESATSDVDRLTLTWLFKPCCNVFCEPAKWFNYSFAKLYASMRAATHW